MSNIILPRVHKAVSGDAQSEHDASTNETLRFITAVSYFEDFIGPGHVVPDAGAPSVGYPWCYKYQKTAGNPSTAVVANYSGGLMRVALDATDEKQEATLYQNDSLGWDMTKCAMFEARISNHVVPGAGVELVFGLHSAWIDGPDNAAYYARFQETGNGSVNFQTKDGVNTISKASTTVMVADAFHIFRIDATDPTNVRFFIDGVEVSTAHQMSFAAVGANAVLQPYFSVYKGAATASVGTLDVDKIGLGMNRS